MTEYERLKAQKDAIVKAEHDKIYSEGYRAALEAACRVTCWACATPAVGSTVVGPAYLEDVEGGSWVHKYLSQTDVERLCDCRAAPIRALMQVPA